MTPLRLLISSQHYHPAYAFGGTVANAVAIAEGLVRLGHEVTVVTTTTVAADARPACRGRVERVNGVVVHYLGTVASLRNVRISPGVFGLMFGGVLRFDLLHVIGLYDSISPPLVGLARRRGVPHTLEPAGMLVRGVRSVGPKLIYRRTVARRVLDAATVVVTSEKERHDALQYGYPPEKLALRRNGVDLAPFQGLQRTGRFRQELGVGPECPLLLFLGRVNPMKNLHCLLAALAGADVPRWHLAVVGPIESSPYRDQLAAQARSLEIDGRVSWVGPRYGPEKLAALADSDLLVLVSVSENWGNTASEAVAAGVPVMITSSCGAAELAEQGAGLVVDPDVASIRAGLERLLNDAGLRAEFKSRLPQIALAQSWDGPVGFMSDLFVRLVRGRAGVTR